MAKLQTTDTVAPVKQQAATQSKTMAGKRTVKTKGKITKTLDDLFVEELNTIYDAEKQLIEALPVMAKAAYNENLLEAFDSHLEQTKRQVERLEKVFDRLRIDRNEEQKCEAMEGLVTECNQIIDEFETTPVRDSALIIAAQKIEHYEIASYGSLCELADVLGYTKIAELLDRSLEEEETTDKNLTVIAQDINDMAFELEHEEIM